MNCKQIHAAKMKAARRKLRKKRARWGAKTIIRGSGKGSSSQLGANRRKSMNVSRMVKHG